MDSGTGMTRTFYWNEKGSMGERNVRPCIKRYYFTKATFIDDCACPDSNLTT